MISEILAPPLKERAKMLASGTEAASCSTETQTMSPESIGLDRIFNEDSSFTCRHGFLNWASICEGTCLSLHEIGRLLRNP